ncbi:hypothetical protein PR202_gb25520 [Eleusine coracana subsp. coracana]|uniref:BTB domain-containing protein n=1 Tax=Eleusine coracana subsp. coracana TaxID=191504 RepID=A0AAV5FQ56_ELECO|nr:hypothetical protein PR202_gb25520 [Eleusine coracana subsp. coracana]
MASTSTRRTIVVFKFNSAHGILYFSPNIGPRRSAVFASGGYDWCVHYQLVENDEVHYLSLHLQLATRGARVTASAEFNLVDQCGASPPWKLLSLPPLEFDGDDQDYWNMQGQTLPKSVVDLAPGFGYNGLYCMVIECTVNVVVEPPAPLSLPSSSSSSTSLGSKNKPVLPASDLMEQLRTMYQTGDGADVTFSVDGELFHAHKFILAARSPVFNKELYGWAKESTSRVVEVEEIKPDAFKALLHYIYTDTLLITPDDNDVEEDDDSKRTTKVRDLLEAADRFGVERLKLMCEHELCKVVSVKNMATMLNFADKHRCDALKDACIESMATSDRWDARERLVQLSSCNPSILPELLDKSIKWARRRYVHDATRSICSSKSSNNPV